MKNKIVVLIFLLSIGPAFAGSVASIPANMSLRGIADWALSGGHIGSGTGAIPTPNATGAVYIDISTPTTPILYYSTDGASFTVVASGGGSGISTHSNLLGLDFADAGHTGFASETTVNNHIADTVDPHGASMTVTEVVNVGVGSFSGSIESTATGVVKISSYTVIIPESATPSAVIATGTLWYDSNVNALKCYDGSAWNALW